MTDWRPLWLSLQVTAVAMVGILILGLALAWLLTRVSFRGKLLLETLVYLPLVLPPTVVGYYLLFVLGRGSPLVEWLRIDLLFTWQAAAVAGLIVGLPLMVQTAKAAFEEVEAELEQAARVDGASAWQVWWHITLPIARRGILAGVILSAARTLGEFGATLMVAGSIPGRTQTLPMAIYDAVQARRYDDAGAMVLVMTVLSFAGLRLVYHLGTNSEKRAAHHDNKR